MSESEYSHIKKVIGIVSGKGCENGGYDAYPGGCC